MSVSPKPLVLVIGGAGRTGLPLINSMNESGAFRIATLTRPESVSKPAVETLKSMGVEIRLGDFARDAVEKLAEVLKDVDVLISVVSAEAILAQKNMLKAAKQAGVKRVVPCDFATACIPGRRALHDEKLEIRAFVSELGVPYTIIDVGFWTQLVLPQQSSNKTWLASITREVVGTGDVKSAITDITDIGRFVARIIVDPRTVNRYVFCWSDHVSQNDIYQVADRLGGENFSAVKVHRYQEEVTRLAAEGRRKYEESGEEQAHIQWTYYEYLNSMYVHGDNTLEKAKAQGGLDARELYPDFKPINLEETAKTFYGSSQFVLA